jgi:hypothetical protein
VTTRYGDCLCGLNDECQQQVTMYSNGNIDSYELKFFIPNFFIGCFVIQSVLQSSLECFFNQTCLDAVQTEIISNRLINVSILHANTTRFSPKTHLLNMYIVYNTRVHSMKLSNILQNNSCKLY